MANLSPIRMAVRAVLVGISLIVLAGGARAAELRVATQFGLTYLPLLIMQNDKLIEKHAQKLGVPDLKVEWGRFAHGGAMNDALLSGRLDIVPTSIPAFLTLWNKTVGTSNAVIGIASLSSLPLSLNTRNPALKSVSDLTDKDRIAMSAVKVSTFAIMLQMTAAKLYGDKEFDRFDRLTVSMAHPDGMAALLSGVGEVNSHFTSPPFNAQELEHPGIRSILDARSVFGGPVSFALNFTTEKFYRENPKLMAAFVAAFKEATDEINKDKRKAAERYIALENSKASVNLVEKIMRDPDTDFSLTPHGMMQMADFMAKVGSIKHRPASWKALFIPEVHGLPGS